MKKMILKIIKMTVKILTFIPFFKLFLKLFYLASLKKIKYYAQGPPEQAQNTSADILDIILTSNFNSKQFTYGESDLNILIIVNNNCHPKAVLTKFREFVSNSLLLSMTVNQSYIPILTEAELQTDTIKSFLIRRSHKAILKWNSILSDKIHTYHLRKQDHFAIIHNSVQSLDHFLLKEYQLQTKRKVFKNIYRAIQNLHKFLPDEIPKDINWKNDAKMLQRLPFLSVILGKKFLRSSWNLLTSRKDDYKICLGYQNVPVKKNLQKYLESLLSLEFINDFTLTPSLIQNDPEIVSGKLFIDIHVSNSIVKNNFIKQIENIISRLKQFETPTRKLRIRITTDSLYQLQNERAYYPFPLEALYRREKTYSVVRKDYHFLIIHEQIILNSIHFLTTEFMRFRSLRHKTDLIGSKFIKSLNLMYKYYLVSEFLKGTDIKFNKTEQQIREQLTPQFTDLQLEDVVTQKHWKIIKAQLLYFLKEIRDELLQHDTGLKILKF